MSEWETDHIARCLCDEFFSHRIKEREWGVLLLFYCTLPNHKNLYIFFAIKYYDDTKNLLFYVCLLLFLFDVSFLHKQHILRVNAVKMKQQSQSLSLLSLQSFIIVCKYASFYIPPFNVVIYWKNTDYVSTRQSRRNFTIEWLSWFNFYEFRSPRFYFPFDDDDKI